MIDVIDTGLIFRNPTPHLRAVHAWHPTIVRLSDGSLLAAFDLGQAVECLDYGTFVAQSHDDGRTWTPPKPLFRDCPMRPARHTMRLSRVSMGKIVGFGARRFYDFPDEGIFNRQTFGHVPMELLLISSSDEGRTWEGPRTIAPPLMGPFEICHPVLELDDGRWLAPTSTLRNWEGKSPTGLKAVALVSYDRGASWPEFITVMSSETDGVVYTEQSVIQLTDRRLLAVAWALNEVERRSLPTPFALSDDGKTFGPQQLSGLAGETAKLLGLGDNRVLCVYRGASEPGLRAAVARIEGDRWKTIHELLLWRGSSSRILGHASVAEEISSLKFGFPNLLQLPDGTIFVAFWCCEDCIFNIRWLRLRVQF